MSKNTVVCKGIQTSTMSFCPKDMHTVYLPWGRVSPFSKQSSNLMKWNEWELGGIVNRLQRHFISYEHIKEVFCQCRLCWGRLWKITVCLGVNFYDSGVLFSEIHHFCQIWFALRQASTLHPARKRQQSAKKSCKRNIKVRGVNFNIYKWAQNKKPYYEVLFLFISDVKYIRIYTYPYF